MFGSVSPRRLVCLLSGLALAGLVGCSKESLSPTAPEATPAAASAPSTAPNPSAPGAGRRAAGRLAGIRAEDAGAAPEAPAEAPLPDVAAIAEGGKGGNGNKGKGDRPKDGGGALQLDLQPDVWNTNWEHSGGTVSAQIRGTDLDEIELGSIVLVGTDPAAAPLPALRAELHGNHVRAFFAKDDALATLDTPARGEVHEVAVEFDQDGAPQSLSDTVRIVGPGGDDDDEEEVDLRLDIQPDAWNLNWKKSHGTVTALIRGDGLATIDLASIVLVGTDPAAAPLPALRAKLSGNHVRAWFAQSQALATLDTPKRGEKHEVTIRLMADGAEVELTDEIRIVGPNR